MMKKITPALRVSLFSCSKLTRQYAVNAMISQQMRKKNAFEAVNTSVVASSRVLKKAASTPTLFRP